jgi:hypothetical protein
MTEEVPTSWSAFFNEFRYGVSGITERYLKVSKVFFNLSH